MSAVGYIVSTVDCVVSVLLTMLCLVSVSVLLTILCLVSDCVVSVLLTMLRQGV